MNWVFLILQQNTHTFPKAFSVSIAFQILKWVPLYLTLFQMCILGKSTNFG